MGGEKLLTSAARSGAAGSPPRGRGKGGLQGGAEFIARITPAWAGKRKNFLNVGKLI